MGGWWENDWWCNGAKTDWGALWVHWIPVALGTPHCRKPISYIGVGCASEKHGLKVQIGWSSSDMTDATLGMNGVAQTRRGQCQDRAAEQGLTRDINFQRWAEAEPALESEEQKGQGRAANTKGRVRKEEVLAAECCNADWDEALDLAPIRPSGGFRVCFTREEKKTARLQGGWQVTCELSRESILSRSLAKREKGKVWAKDMSVWG